MEPFAAAGDLFPEPEQQASLRAGFSVSVVSADRPGALIPRIFSTSDYLLSPCGALVYGGLMDYRALTGRGRPPCWREESPCGGARRC